MNGGITIYEGLDHAVTMPAPPTRLIWSLDLAFDLWLDAKFKHSSSIKTRKAYRDTLQRRAALQRAGLDLDSVASFLQHALLLSTYN